MGKPAKVKVEKRKREKEDSKGEEDAAVKAEAPAVKKQKVDRTSPKTDVKIKCQAKKLLSSVIQSEFEGIKRIAWPTNFNIGFLEFDSAKHLQKAIKRGNVEILGVTLFVKENSKVDKKGGSATAGCVVGKIWALWNAVFKKHLRLDAVIVAFGNGVICRVPENQARKAVKQGPVDIEGVSCAVSFYEPGPAPAAAV
jgi:hypothetical protein